MSRLRIPFLDREIAVSSLDDDSWDRAEVAPTEKYWSGEKAPRNRYFSARPFWSNSALYVRFEAIQKERLIVAEHPDITKKTIGLWDRDVCEIFIAPDNTARNKYFEFEVAPTGEWIDIAMEIVDGKRCPDLEYSSGMETFARIEEDHVVMAMKIPWTAFGVRPQAGDVWRGNIFRCVGAGENRGYLAWQPTMTVKPDFHVPSAFGGFEFIK